MAEIQLRNVGKRWGSCGAVDNFELTIADREFLVRLGPSGCGKTTTMRMIAGLEDVTEGEILIDGKVINDRVGLRAIALCPDVHRRDRIAQFRITLKIQPF